MRLKADNNSSHVSNQIKDPPTVIPPITIETPMRDSGGDDEIASMLTLIERDRVREYLEKNPSDRTEKDIQFLLDFMQHMPAFSNMTMSMKRSLCRVMVFAVVEKSGTVVLGDGERLDSWSVILNGHVEVARQDGTIQHLHMGDSFGVSATRDTLLQEGVMMTKSDDCQFVCIPQEDFYDILHKEKENIIKISDSSGEVVMVMEKRELEIKGNFVQGKVVLRGTPDMLMQQLMDDNIIDNSYTSDFLLTYRTFMKSHIELVDYLLSCLQTIDVDKSVQVMHVWLLNHFVDFESNIDLFLKLEKFFEVLKEKNMTMQTSQLQQICTDRAHVRQVLFVLKNDEEPLQFVLGGGQERSAKIFVSHVDEMSPASKAGLRVADQIISVNNHNLDGITLEKAYEFLQMTNHLMLTVKSNLFDFEMLRMKTSSSSSPRDLTSPTKNQSEPWGRAHLFPLDPEGSISSVDSSPLKSHRRIDQSPQASRLRQALGKMNLMQKSETCENYTGFRNSISSASAVLDSSSSWNNISWNQSVDLHLQPGHHRLLAIFSPDNPKHPYGDMSAIAIFRADQTCKHILVKKCTTVRDAVEAALVEFEIAGPSNHYSLCQITLDEKGTVKTKHLPNHVSDLSERCTLNSRYYLRDTRLMEKLISGDLTNTLSADVNFLQLPFGEVATQLTQRDMRLFCSIDPVEYVNDLFEISHVPQLTRFSELVNEEMFWVVTEVCSEQNCLKRSKILKQFVKIAEKCHKLKNFNSMFAILSGLGHGSVSRLRQTWEKLPDKYHKLFEEMQGVMDPSRNMLKYRNLLLSSQPPVIPFFPLVKKDLTFIHFGNDSRIDGLINFDKLRMIAKEIRLIYKMASVTSHDKLYPAKASRESLINSGSSTSLITVTPSKKFVPSFSASSASLTMPTTTGIFNARKIYEEGQTSRTVKTYIANLKIISDETKLLTMSVICESNGKSRKATPSSSSALNLRRNVLDPQVTGPRFGSENPTSILKLMSLTEDARPIVIGGSTSKNSSSDLTNGKKAPKDKNKSKHFPQPLHLSFESSSVSNNINGKKTAAARVASPLKIVQLKRNKSCSPIAMLSSLSSSHSNSSLSLSSSSSSSLSSTSENKMASSAKATESGRQTSDPSSSSSSPSSQSDNVSSSTSSGICSLESTSSTSLHHHHHRDKYYNMNIAHDLDSLPSAEIDDEEDDDGDDDDDEDCGPITMGSRRHLNMKEREFQFDTLTKASRCVDLPSDTFHRPHDPGSTMPCDLEMLTNKMNVPKDGAHSPKFHKIPHQHQTFHNGPPKMLGMLQTPSSSSPSSMHRDPPSYKELLSLKQNAPCQGDLQDNCWVAPRVSVSSPAFSRGLRMHSRCCCCSICFQSSYDRRCLNAFSGNGASQQHNIPLILVQRPYFHNAITDNNNSVNFYEQEKHFGIPPLPTSQVLCRSRDLRGTLQLQTKSLKSGIAYKPYTTVLEEEDDDDELVTLV